MQQDFNVVKTRMSNFFFLLHGGDTEDVEASNSSEPIKKKNKKD